MLCRPRCLYSLSAVCDPQCVSRLKWIFSFCDIRSNKQPRYRVYLVDRTAFEAWCKVCTKRKPSFGAVAVSPCILGGVYVRENTLFGPARFLPFYVSYLECIHGVPLRVRYTTRYNVHTLPGLGIHYPFIGQSQRKTRGLYLCTSSLPYLPFACW